MLGGLHANTSVSTGQVLPPEFQTPGYTAAVIGSFTTRGLIDASRDIQREPDLRHERVEAVVVDKDVTVRTIMSMDSLTTRMGSAAIMVGALELAEERIRTHLDDGLPGVDAVIYEKPGAEDRVTKGYDPRFDDYGTFLITESDEHGRRVWVADAGVMVPTGSVAQSLYLGLAEQLNEIGARDEDALAIVRDSLEFWRGQED